jgi:hypothetical protein
MRHNDSQAVEESIYRDMLAYRDFPCEFAASVLSVKDEYIWPGMRAVIESVRDNQLTAVPAGHSVSKTFSAGRIIVPWFKTCFQPSTIITTAPSDNQIRNQLWREIHAAYASAKIPLGGNMTALQWDVRPSDQTLKMLDPEFRAMWEKNFAIGFSTSPDNVSENVTKMQGWHNYWMLIVLDEAGGILPQIWRTIMDSLVTNERVKVLAIGNPTSSYGDFIEAIKPGSGWNVINLSVLDTPNYKEGREVIPGVAGRPYEEKIAKSYGRDSMTYRVRVLGLPSDYSEASYYGAQVAQARADKRIGQPVPVAKDTPVHRAWDLGPMHKAVWFWQNIGDEIRVVDYYEDNSGLGLSFVVQAMNAKPYPAGDNWAGPDFFGSNAKQMSGKTLADECAELGLHFNAVLTHKVDTGIELTRGVLKRCCFDRDRCKPGLYRLEAYHAKKVIKYSSPDKPVLALVPEKDGNEHCADAMRHLAKAYVDYYAGGGEDFERDLERDERFAVAGEAEGEDFDDSDEETTEEYDA